MQARQHKHSKEEVKRRGEEIYQQKVRPLVEEGNRGKFVAIDVDTGEFELDDEFLNTCKRLFARLPDAQAWYVRIGDTTGQRASRMPARYIWYNSVEVAPERIRKYSLEEHGRLAEEIYQKQIRPLVEEGNRGRIVAIDVDTGAFEVADDLLTAGDRLFERLPNAPPAFFIRIGYPFVYHISRVPDDHRISFVPHEKPK